MPAISPLLCTTATATATATATTTASATIASTIPDAATTTAVAAAITIYGFYLALPYYKGIQKRFLNMAILAGIGYVIYMVGVDVPTYISNWQTAEAAGKTYLSVADGLAEISTTWHYTRAYVDWEYEMVWMTLYFSLAVWMSIYIVNAPKLDQNIKTN